MPESQNKGLKGRDNPDTEIAIIMSWCQKCFTITPQDDIKECIHEQCGIRYCKKCGFNGCFCSKNCFRGYFQRPHQH